MCVFRRGRVILLIHPLFFYSDLSYFICINNLIEDLFHLSGISICSKCPLGRLSPCTCDKNCATNGCNIAGLLGVMVKKYLRPVVRTKLSEIGERQGCGQSLLVLTVPVG